MSLLDQAMDEAGELVLLSLGEVPGWGCCYSRLEFGLCMAFAGVYARWSKLLICWGGDVPIFAASLIL